MVSELSTRASGASRFARHALWPPVKPRFTSLRISCTQGNSVAIISGLPSVEPLSMTITSNLHSSRNARRLAKHARVSEHVFQLQIVTLSSKPAVIAFRPHECRRVDECRQRGDAQGGERPRAMFPQEPYQAAVRFPDHAFSHLLRALSTMVLYVNIRRV